MGETKKPAAKQASIASFFSPTRKTDVTSPPAAAKSPESPAVINADAFTTPSPATNKRKRPAATSSAKKKLATTTDDSVVDLTTPGDKDKDEAAAPKQKRGRKAKANAKPKAKANAKPKATVVLRGVSPHEGPANADDDSDDDDDADDVRARDVDAPTGDVDTSAAVPELAEVAEVVAVDDDETLTKPTAKTKKKLAPSPPVSAPAAHKPKRAAKKDKDTVNAAGASPAASPQKAPAPVPPLPVDPVVRARIASYRQKIDELTQLCDRLAHANATDDNVLHEIYGFGLDTDLHPATDDERAEAADAWRALSKSTETTTGAVDIPDVLKRFAARLMQSRSDSLTALVKRVETALGVSAASTTMQLALELEMKTLAQRTPHGAKPANANLYEDTTPEALWCWEVSALELYFTHEAQKTIKRLRSKRKRTGGQLRALVRVVQLLHQPPIDETKVGNEEAKIGKFASHVATEEVKAREREKRDEEKSRKEQEKAHALEEKKRLEHEKQAAKEEEKRRKESEAEAKRQAARQSFASFFVATDATSSASEAEVARVAAPSAKHTSTGLNTTQLETMARMDRNVSYLVNDADEAPASSQPASPVCSGAALLQRQRSLVTARTGHWSARRYRDQKLGLMKLLQFHENYRPAYYGTFSKRSVVFRRGRRPLAQYASFDYTVDSEEEWEEEEPGESLSGADSDMDDDDDDQLDYGDDWLAYEDEVEYVDGAAPGDDDDVVMDDDENDGDDEHDDAAASRKRRRRRVAAENKKQKLTKLEPQFSGPFVCADLNCHDHLNGYVGALFVTTPEFESPLLKRARARQNEATAEPTDAATPVTTKKKPKAATPATKKSTTSATPAPIATAATTTKTTHKPPVKRKISPQLASASDAAPAPPKKADDTTATTNGLAQWLHTPAPAAAAPSSTATTTASPSSDAPKAPVEI